MADPLLGKQWAVIQGDCRQVLAKMPDNYVDMVCTDPPWNVSQNVTIHRSMNPEKYGKYAGKDISLDFGDWDHFESEAHYLKFTAEWMEQAARVTKEAGHLVIFFDQDKVTDLIRIATSLGCSRRQHLYWLKCLSGNAEVWVRRDGWVSREPLSTLYSNWPDCEILTPDGFKPVLNMSKRYASGYKLTTPLGSFHASRNHRFPYWIPNNNIQWDRTLAHFCSLKKPRLLTCWRAFDNPVVAEAEGFPLTRDWGWLVGLWIAEGNYDKNTQIRFSLNIKEEAFVKRIRDIVETPIFYNSKMQPNGVSVFTHETLEYGARAVYFGSGRIKRFIQTFVKGKGAHGKRLDLATLFNTPIEFREGLWEGIYDGDGSKTAPPNRLMITLCNEGLVDDLTWLLFSLGIPSRYWYQQATCQGKHFDAYVLKTTFGKPMHHSKLPVGIRPLRRPDLTIEPSEIRLPMYDLQVEGSIFIVGRGLLSHNSNPVPRARKVDFMIALEHAVWFTKEPRKGATFNYQLGQQSNVVKAPIVHHTRRIHTTQKPIAVLSTWIRYLSNEGDLILDPFCGSGATVVTALRLSRRAIGIEQDKGYAAAARKWIIDDCPMLNIPGEAT